MAIPLILTYLATKNQTKKPVETVYFTRIIELLGRQKKQKQKGRFFRKRPFRNNFSSLD